MAGLLDLFGGGGSDPYDIYGDLFTDKQKQAMRDQQQGQGLLRMAAALGQAAMPSRLPVPLGAVLGSAAGALGTGQDAQMEQMLKAAQTAEAVRQSRQKRALQDQISPILLRLIEQQKGLPAGSLGTGTPVAAAPAGSAAPVGGGGPNAPPPAAAAPGPFDLGGLGVSPAAAGGTGALPLDLGGTTSGAPIPLDAPAASTAGEPRVTGKGIMPRGGLVTPEDYERNLGIAPGSGGGVQRQSALTEVPSGLGPLAAPAAAGPDQLVGQAPSQLQGLLSAAYGGGGANGTPPFSLASLSGGSDAASPEELRKLGLIKQFESRNRNIMQGVVGPQGGYNPSVGRVTGPSSAGGYYQMIDPTWRHAAAQAGIDTEKYPKAITAPPEAQDAAALALLRERGTADWAPYNKLLAAALGGQDTVIPSGRGVPASALQRVADTGGGTPGAGRIPTLGPIPTLDRSTGAIPGIGMTPQGVAALNALTEMGGLGEPFKSLLETYYKSPEYLQQAAGAGAAGTLPFDLYKQQSQSLLAIKQDMAKDNMTIDDKGNIVPLPEAQRIRTMNASEIAAAQEAWKARFNTLDATVLGPDGQPTTQKMTQYEFAQRQQSQADRARMGPAAPRPGDIVGTPANLGATPPGYQYRTTPQGTLSAQPIPGTPAAEEAAAVARNKAISDRNLLVSRDIVVQNADRLEDLAKNSTLPVTGAGGAFLSRLGGTAANDARVLIETLKARSSLDALNQMRQASPTGGALGNVSNAEGDRLAAALSNLDQSQTQDQFLFNLRRAKEAYIDAVHGPGAYSSLSDKPVMKTPSTAPPPIGTVRDGYSFKGGNPADPNSWQKVQ
jgi:hypothetical protein